MQKTLQFTTSTQRTITEQIPGSVNLTREIKQAMRVWLANEAYWKQTRWDGRISHGAFREKATGLTTKWNASVHIAFPADQLPDAFSYAARAAREAGLL